MILYHESGLSLISLPPSLSISLSLSLAAFGLDFYTEVLDLSLLLKHLQDHPFTRKYKKLNEMLTGVVEDYSLVSFFTLDIQVRIFMLAENWIVTQGFHFYSSSTVHYVYIYDLYDVHIISPKGVL